jgi:hypothetical protein
MRGARSAGAAEPEVHPQERGAAGAATCFTGQQPRLHAREG